VLAEYLLQWMANERNYALITYNSEAVQQKKLQRIFQLLFVVVGLLLATLLIYLTDGDKELAKMMYGSNNLWPGINQFPWNILYDRAPIPGFFIVGLALLICITGFFSIHLKTWRREAVFFLLLMAIGPGLIVNVCFKDNLGRARPREIVECGGSHQYTEIWEKGTTGANSSFPSGHASVAFYTLAPWFIFRDKKIVLAGGFLASGIFFGSAVGLARMLQGGHFLSDVLWAGGIVYLVGGISALFLLPMGSSTDHEHA